MRINVATEMPNSVLYAAYESGVFGAHPMVCVRMSMSMSTLNAPPFAAEAGGRA